MVRIDLGSGRMAGDSIQAQPRRALAHCEAIFREAGATRVDVVEAGVLLTEPGDFTGMNEEYAGRSRLTHPPDTQPSQEPRYTSTSVGSRSTIVEDVESTSLH